MRSLALIAFLSQFGLQGASRCAPAPQSPSPSEPAVEEPIDTESTSEATTLDRFTDYAASGAFLFDEVEEATLALETGRRVKVSVFEPRRSGALPMVIVSPGFQLKRDFYRSYAEHLASWGFLVVTQTYDGSVSGLFNSDHAKIAEDTLALIDTLATDGLLNLNVNREAVALVGHSLGGKISILAGVLEPEIAAVVGLDPVDANTPSVTPELIPSLAAPLLLLGETLDSRGLLQACAPADNNFEQYFADAPSGTVLLDIQGAGHMQFHDEPRCLLCRVCSNATTAESEQVLAMSRDALTPFLLATLENLGGWEAYVAEGILSQRWTPEQVVQSVR